MILPKISVVTPCFNDVEYLEETIVSIIEQNYPNLEYIIVDGGSSDGSVDILKKYANKLTSWSSEKDQGMYYAIKKGFEKTTGEIMMWLNSDDLLHPKSLFTIGQIYRDYSEINWIQGKQNIIDEKGRIVYAGPAYEMDRFFFYQKKHVSSYKYIQQESTSWRRSLWEQAGGYISTEYKYAGDFDLWIRFFQHEKLYNINALIGAFRLSGSGQASLDHYDEYVGETLKILEKYPLKSTEARKIKYLRYWQKIESILGKYTDGTKKKISSNSLINNKVYFDHNSQSFKMHK